jgi:hypothetical protein
LQAGSSYTHTIQQSLVENIAFTSFVGRLQVWTCCTGQCTVFCFVATESSASGDQTTDTRTTFDFAMIAVAIQIICNVLRHS